MFGKALQRYPGVRLHGFDAQSNHLHYLVSATEPAQLPLFFGFVHSNIARQLNDLRRRTGVFWSRRAKVIPVLDPDAQLDRLTYLLSQGPKSKLVASPKDWPGACSTPGLLGDMTLPARYKGLDACRRNRLRRQPRPEVELEEDVSITLTPLPALGHLPPTELRAVHEGLVATIEAAHAGDQVLGAQHLIEQDPETRPENFVPSPAPRCHAQSTPVRLRFNKCYRTFQDRYRGGAGRVRERPADKPVVVMAGYPPGAMIRAHWHKPGPAELANSWLYGTDDIDAFEAPF
ncbi:MAG: hypothetical protein KBG48_08790 [Kofleriaceae bacterium]|nr:hypothetical protein [Kofleriaceae bacterium]MBP9167470.1 hypothetical protein [Kofleriaceae bacterium]MBP9861040.1 hypothetical protein [Kofleriaceae bacterium]